MTIPSTSYPIEGNYNILWSSTAQFKAGETTIIKSGTVPGGTTTVVDSFVIPEASFGVHYVGFARLGYEVQPTILSFNVQPHLKVQPVSVSPDTTVKIYGTGFSTGDTGLITFDGKPTDVTITANEVGSFIIDFIIPSVSAAQHQVSVVLSKLSTNVAPAMLLVVPEITIDPQLPKAGAEVRVTGRGFAANSSISIQCNGLILTSSPSTDDTGNFTYSFTLSQSYQSGYKFVATDQVGNTATFNSSSGNTPLPSTPPPSTPPPSTPAPSPPQTPQKPASVNGRISKPTVIEPQGQRFGLFGAQMVNFVWNQVSAPGGITYTLEVADNYKFSGVKPGMRASGLTQTNYTIELDPGTYYWRVKAVDGSGNESEWANSLYTFNVGLFPGWVLPVAGVVYLVIFILLIRALLRRLSRSDHYY